MLMMLADIVYWIVILLHLSFVVLEMALWKKMAPKVFGMSQEFANHTAKIASNQGLYNLFIVVALLIGYFSDIIDIGASFMLYGLGCALVAGIWGGITVSRRILFVQGLPALIALGLRLAMAVQ
jgi:putative membrane protein